MSREVRTHHYDFHGLFRLTVQSDSKRAQRHFQAEYGSFATNRLEPPDLRVSLIPFSLRTGEANNSSARDHGDGDDWLCFRERHKVATWQLALKGLNAPTTQLRFQGGIFSLDYLQHYVEQIMRFKISQRGYLLVHAGCIARDGRAVLFPGLGHAGKTALALQQVLAGRQFQSDDYTFLSTSGETYSYPRRLHISEHIDAVCPAALKGVSLRHKVSIKAKFLIYYLTLKYGDLSESLQLEEMIPNAPIAATARLRAVLLLVGMAGSELSGPVRLERTELVDHVMQVNRFEAKRFQKVLLRDQRNGCSRSPEEWYRREREVLRQALDDVPGYEVQVPRQARNPEATMEQLGRIVTQVLE